MVEVLQWMSVEVIVSLLLHELSFESVVLLFSFPSLCLCIPEGQPYSSQTLIATSASIVMFHGVFSYSSNDIINKFETLNEEHVIGSGGFGTVYRLAMEDGNLFVLKRIVKMNDSLDRFVERELEILGSIKHWYLVNLQG